MSVLILVCGLVGLFIVAPVLIGRFCKMTDDIPHQPLHRRPNVKLVPRDEKDAAA